MDTKFVKLMVVMGVMFVSVVALVVKSASAPLITTAFFRLFFTVLIMLPVVVAKNNRNTYFPQKELLLSILSGLILGVHFFGWFVALDYTTVANATVIVDASSVFTLLGGHLFLNDKMTKKETICVMATFVGAILLTYRSLSFASNEYIGILLSVMSSVTLSIYMLIGRRVRRTISNLNYTFVVYLFGSIFLAACTMIMEGTFTGFPKSNYLIFLYLAIFPTLLGHSIFSWSLKYIKASFSATMLLFVPVVSIIGAYFLFDELPLPEQFVGAGIIILSLFAFTLGKDEARKNLDSDKEEKGIN
ncbi:EamA family transporter [Clostridia bacterium]|nr:EamA family transporter [Clostridia bacterium]